MADENNSSNLPVVTQEALLTPYTESTRQDVSVMAFANTLQALNSAMPGDKSFAEVVTDAVADVLKKLKVSAKEVDEDLARRAKQREQSKKEAKDRRVKAVDQQKKKKRQALKAEKANSKAVARQKSRLGIADSSYDPEDTQKRLEALRDELVAEQMATSYVKGTVANARATSSYYQPYAPHENAVFATSTIYAARDALGCSEEEECIDVPVNELLPSEVGVNLDANLPYANKVRVYNSISGADITILPKKEADSNIKTMFLNINPEEI